MNTYGRTLRGYLKSQAESVHTRFSLPRLTPRAGPLPVMVILQHLDQAGILQAGAEKAAEIEAGEIVTMLDRRVADGTDQFVSGSS